MKKIIALSLLVLSIFATGCEKKPDTSTATDTTSTDTTSITQETMKTIPEKGDTIATMTTNMGDIKILLYTKQAPETTKNFIELTKAGKYEESPFHRVIPNFMIQGGDFENKNGTGGYSYNGPGTSLKDEFGAGLKHIYGAVSMAKAGPDSAGSQFFIVQAKDGTSWLNGVHAIFGYVYEGMDIVEKIAAVQTDSNDRPKKEVTIKKVDISEY